MAWVDDSAGLQPSLYQIIYFCIDAELDKTKTRNGMT